MERRDFIKSSFLATIAGKIITSKSVASELVTEKKEEIASRCSSVSNTLSGTFGDTYSSFIFYPFNNRS